MLTYDMNARGTASLYEYLYLRIRNDIEDGRLAPGERLPSKRSLAQHLGVSVITVEGAYAQLVAEGYVHARERSGFYVNELPEKPQLVRPPVGGAPAAQDADGAPCRTRDVPRADAWHADMPPYAADFASGALGSAEDAAALWGRAVKAALNEEPAGELFADLPAAGHPRLRRAIAGHLRAVRGMEVEPGRVVVGAGAQLFYALIAQMLGQDAGIAVEDPGFARIWKTYRACGLDVAHAPLDAAGMRVDVLESTGARAVHVMPSHQFPTGTVMSAPRRYELLVWAAQDPARIIVEDDYDCEFRLSGRPVPALASIDAAGQVLYLNTFSKSLSSALRMAYLVLPPALAARFDGEFGFYSGTVSALDQIALARLIESGAYARHINRVRTRHRAVRDVLVAALRPHEEVGSLRFHELDSGLHCVLEVESARPAAELAERAREHGVRLAPLEDFCATPVNLPQGNPRFVIQYGSMDVQGAQEAAALLAEALGL